MITVVKKKNSESLLKNKNILWALLVLVFVFSVFALSICKWFMEGEDFGLIFRVSQIAGLKDFFSIFTHGCVSSLNHPDLSFTFTQQAAGYRPVFLLTTWVQFLFFKISAHDYFLVIILFHAIICSLFFYLSTFFLSPITAFFASLFFAFHPKWFGWLGKVDCQHHQLCLLFALISLFFLMKYLKTHNFFIFIFSLFSFFLSLLSRETFIIFPFMLGLFFILFHKNLELSFKRMLFLFLSFLSVVGIFLFINFLMLSIKQQPVSPSHFSSLKTIIHRTYEYYLTTFIPWSSYYFFKQKNTLYLYVLLRILLIACPLLLFLTNTRKKLVLYFLACAIMLHWPLCLISWGGERYFYEPSLFYIVAFLFLYKYSSLRSKMRSTLLIIAIPITICVNAKFIIHELQKKQAINEKLYISLITLKNKLFYNNLDKTPLLFLVNSKRLEFVGLSQAAYLYKISASPQIFYRDVTETIPSITPLTIAIWDCRNRIFNISLKK